MAGNHDMISHSFLKDLYSTLLGTNISPTKAFLKMVFLLPRQDMLVPLESITSPIIGKAWKNNENKWDQIGESQPEFLIDALSWTPHRVGYCSWNLLLDGLAKGHIFSDSSRMSHEKKKTAVLSIIYTGCLINREPWNGLWQSPTLTV